MNNGKTNKTMNATSDIEPKSLADKLNQLSVARDSQLISHEEYTKSRKDILDAHVNAPTPQPQPSTTPLLLTHPWNHRTEARATRKKCCVKFFQWVAVFFTFIGFCLLIAAVCDHHVGTVWVYCPDSPLPNTCSPECINDGYHHRHHHHHDDDDFDSNKPNATYCNCGQEYYDIGYKGMWWGNATNPGMNTYLSWADVDLDGNTYDVFPLADTLSPITNNDPLLTQTYHLIKVYRIFGFTLLPVMIIILIDMRFLMRKSKTNAEDDPKVTNRGIRIPLFLLTAFSLGVASICILANAPMLRNDYDYEAVPGTIQVYYPKSCSINFDYHFAATQGTFVGFTMWSALCLFLSLCITGCCCRSRFQQYTLPATISPVNYNTSSTLSSSTTTTTTIASPTSTPYSTTAMPSKGNNNNSPQQPDTVSLIVPPPYATSADYKTTV